jgi:hypothetical protein
LPIIPDEDNNDKFILDRDRLGDFIRECDNDPSNDASRAGSRRRVLREVQERLGLLGGDSLLNLLTDGEGRPDERSR